MSQGVFVGLLLLLTGASIYGSVRDKYVLSSWGGALLFVLIATSLFLRGERSWPMYVIYASAIVQGAAGIVEFRRARRT